MLRTGKTLSCTVVSRSAAVFMLTNSNVSVVDRTVEYQHFPPVTGLVLVLVLQ